MTNNIKCIVWQEHNDWEGETWIRFFPYEGNEEAYLKLQEIADQDDDKEEYYEVFLKDIPEEFLNYVNKMPQPPGYMERYEWKNITLNPKNINEDNVGKLGFF